MNDRNCTVSSCSEPEWIVSGARKENRKLEKDGVRELVLLVALITVVSGPQRFC
jgi:hypothetical protein